MRRLLGLCLLLGCGSPGALVVVPCTDVTAEAWPEADRLFADDRWHGGDGAYSVDLGGDEILWLFGETRVDGARVHNSIAIQTGRDPTTATMSFHWPFVPDQGERRLRPRGGARLGPGVILWFAREDAGGEGAGWTGFWIPNPDDDPAGWRREEVFLPALRFPVTLGTAVVVEAPFVYAFGAQEPGDHRVYLARFDYGDAQGVDLSRPQWWSGDWVAHTAFPPEQATLFPGEEREQATELSVSPWPTGWLAVHTLGGSVGVRTAPALTGPWTAPCGALAVGDPAGAKGHPELPGADLVVTYIAGGVPRFLRLHRN